MASGAVTVPLRDLEKIRLYVTDKKEALTASQVRKRTGADVVVNGTLFDPERWVPNCDVKADGKVLNNDPYTYRGLGWNSGEGKFRIAVSGEMESYDNFVSGVLLLWQGKPYPYHAERRRFPPERTDGPSGPHGWELSPALLPGRGAGDDARGAPACAPPGVPGGGLGADAGWRRQRAALPGGGGVSLLSPAGPQLPLLLAVPGGWLPL